MFQSDEGKHLLVVQTMLARTGDREKQIILRYDFLIGDAGTFGVWHNITICCEIAIHCCLEQ